jgi:hypothetical protein
MGGKVRIKEYAQKEEAARKKHCDNECTNIVPLISS